MSNEYIVSESGFPLYGRYISNKNKGENSTTKTKFPRKSNNILSSLLSRSSGN